MATVLITGANRGLGLELASQLSARGDHVIGTARRPDSARELGKVAAEIFALDVTSKASVEQLRQSLKGRAIDILINNSGIIGPERQSTLDMDFEGWKMTLDVNTLGPVRMVQALIENLRAAKAAKVLTLTSYMGSFTNEATDRIAYRSSKTALNKVMQAMAADLKGEGIAVAVAHPGWARTDMGGPSAAVDPADSTAGLIAILDQLDVSTCGKFYNWDGTEHGW